MLLSDLRRWQQALAVPIAELLDEPEGELSRPCGCGRGCCGQ